MFGDEGSQTVLVSPPAKGRLKAIKLQVKLSLCLIKKHAIKTHWGSEDIAP
jgi:hypothetical protein